MKYLSGLISKISVVLMLVLTVIVLRPPKETESLDMGPKPSLTIYLKGTDGLKVYGTFMISDKYYDDLDKPHNMSEEIVTKFLSFEKSDGMRVDIEYIQNCTVSGKVYEGYMPPDEFKVLLYFPEIDVFVVTDEIYDCYAFDSYYTLDLTNCDLKNQSNTIIEIDKGMKYSEVKWRTIGLISLIFRLTLTVGIEVLIGYALFKFRHKKSIKTIIKINIITQLILNLGVDIFNLGGLPGLMTIYFYEFLVLIIEGITYNIHLNNECRGCGTIVGYTIFANFISFILGDVLARYLPQMF